ncbi:MAG: glycosyltransferase, partial [Pseudomonadota bacterium]
MSFRSQLTEAQRKAFKLALASIGISWLLAPHWMLQVTATVLFIVFFLMIAWRSAVLFCGWIVSEAVPFEQAALPNRTHLPIYTILIPAYRERALMSQIARAVQTLDWPTEQLDILMLLEEDDLETIEAAEAAPFPDGTRFCRVPAGGPRTKPNALNHGLSLARGEFVTIYDVEDLPAPGQLREAYKTFRQSDPHLACLQAPLIADNATHSWLTAQWGLEYDIQFRLLLPGLALYQMPLLLGGTSNH